MGRRSGSRRGVPGGTRPTDEPGRAAAGVACQRGAGVGTASAAQGRAPAIVGNDRRSVAARIVNGSIKAVIVVALSESQAQSMNVRFIFGSLPGEPVA